LGSASVLQKPGRESIDSSQETHHPDVREEEFADEEINKKETEQLSN
jgi:hypothetical protein